MNNHSRQKRFIQSFIKTWCSKWKNYPPFVLTFTNHKNFEVYFPDEIQGSLDEVRRDLQHLLWEIAAPRHGPTLRAWRIQEKLSQNEVAKFLGVKRANYTAIERGRRPIGAKLAQRMRGLLEQRWLKEKMAIEARLELKTPS